jgi:hypothetical protein
MRRCAAMRLTCREPMKKLPQIKTYSVSVEGFSPILWSARTASKARATAYRQYLHYDDGCTFRRFLEMSSIRRATDPDFVGKRVVICGRPATAVIPSCGYDGIFKPTPAFMRDDNDVIFTAHPSDVTECAVNQ